ncbi:MAG: SDR family oxidoreductase [Roseibacillus sp.]
MNTLKNKVILVVGGSTGIGLGMARAFAAEDAKVVIAARTEDALQAAVEESPAPISAHPCDASQREQVAALVAWTEREMGPIAILIFCAGVNSPKRTFAEVEPEDFDRVMAINAGGAFNCIHAVLPGMRERKDGLIINVVSLAGLRTIGLAGVPYSAAKYAQASLGSMANLEALPDGVRVTNLYPGETNTPILDQRPVPVSEERKAQCVQPEDIGAIAVAIAKLPVRATVPEIVITPQHMPLL